MPFDEKLLKKSKIRNKDKEMLKLKSRNIFDNNHEIKIKSKSPELEEMSLTYCRADPNEIPVPPLKSLSSTSKTKQKFKPEELSLSDSINLMHEMKNHKKIASLAPKSTDLFNKFKTNKIEKVKSKSEDLVNSLDDMKSLKRQHSSSPVNSNCITLNSTGSEGTSATLVNGIMQSPDLKKRKLSDGVLGK